MANSFDSNYSRKLMRSFLKGFESARVLSKNVNTQLFSGQFNPASGTTVDVKRPHDYKSISTAGGDISSSTKSDIISGKATATVQNYITVAMDFDNVDEALKMDQLEEMLAPAATRIAVDLERNFASYALKYAGLYAGTYGTAASTWDHVAEWGAMLEAHGVPQDKMWCAFVNPFTRTDLASNQRSLGAGGSAGSIIKSAHEKAILTDNFAGMKVMSCTTLPSVTSGAGADRAGTLSATPTATYASVKDTMTMTLAVTGMDAALPIKAGQIVEVTGRNRLNLSTRDAIAPAVKWSGVVTADVTLSGGAGNIVVSGPAIYEATGAYNTVDSALTSGDVVTVLGAASTVYSPNMFWHPDAFTIASVKLPKLYSTDTIGTTKDGLSIRVSKYADGDKNQQSVRFDLLPAFGCLNPFFAGQGWGAS
jgi:hypothetical protein